MLELYRQIGTIPEDKDPGDKDPKIIERNDFSIGFESNGKVYRLTLIKVTFDDGRVCFTENVTNSNGEVIKSSSSPYTKLIHSCRNWIPKRVLLFSVR